MKEQNQKNHHALSSFLGRYFDLVFSKILSSFLLHPALLRIPVAYEDSFQEEDLLQKSQNKIRKQMTSWVVDTIREGNQ